MLHRQRSWLGLSMLLALALATPATLRAADDQDPAALWSDFNHYVIIASPDLAQAAGTALLGKVNDSQLLDIVEKSVASNEYADYQDTLDRAMKVDSLRDVATQLSKRIQAARIARARDLVRINADIHKLGENERARINALVRLRAAGQYAVPAMLTVLVDPNQARLHPYVLDGLIAMGEPAVAPLSVALPGLEPVPQGQIAHVLAEIGYPRALPAMQRIIENPDTDPTTRQTVKTAFEQLAKSVNLDPKINSSMLYLSLARNFYNQSTRNFQNLPDLDHATNSGLVWSYTRMAGLQFVLVPAEIFGDIEAMDASMQALKLNPNLDAALSTWLMANLRRANRLPQGQNDPSYPSSMRPPIFYARAAGPARMQDVLGQALVDHDTTLALDAIGALSDTAGTEALVNRKGQSQPLVQALYYPDRRVRFAAAFTFCQARPKAKFPGSDRVVTVLAEAVRQSASRYAVVIGTDQDSTNKMVGILSGLKYQAFGGTNINQALDAVMNEPGVDLIVTNFDADHVKDLVAQTSGNYKLAGAPILALTTAGSQIALNARYGTEGRVRSATWTADAAALTAAVNQATMAYAGKEIDAKEALADTTKALNLLATIAVGAGDVFNVSDAQVAVADALNDSRPDVPVLAAQVLDKISAESAQHALANAALDPSRPEPVRISLVNALSESATMFGNHLTTLQVDKITKLLGASEGEMAIAVARLHGALSLPTVDIKQMIVR